MRKGSRPSVRAAMTLIELLVAFIVFLMLVGMLVSLSTSALRTWETGEARKDIYDRAQRTLHQVADDLRNTFADSQWYFTNDGRRLLHAGMYCEPDPAKVQRLRLVRCGDETKMKIDPAMTINRAAGSYTDLWEVAYQLNPPNKPAGLYRGVRYFTRTNPSILDNKELDATTSQNWTTCFKIADDGVLWIGFKFWTQYTTTWDTKVAVKAAARQMKQVDTHTAEPITVGPSLFWDSSRSRIGQFTPFYRPLGDDDPDFVYPEIVQVTLQVESRTSGVRGIRTADPIDATAATIRLTDARPLPDPDPISPGFIKIQDEWIEYKGKDGNELSQCQRGARGTRAVAHPLNTGIQFGETFITDVQVPAYREKVR